MGKTLYDFYLKAGEIGGINARTRLSMLTKISSSQANSMPDSPVNIQLFEEAMKSILKEFGNGVQASGAVKPTAAKLIETNPEEIVRRLRKHIYLFSDLTAQRSLYQNDLSKAYQRITESLTDAINVERASIWLYDRDKTLIECVDLFERTKGTHAKGTKLMAKDFPNYFNTIRTERTLAAHDAHTDPGTKEFSEIYLKPLGINSMLDTPIWVDGEMVGVLCHEHVGPKRIWSADEENFAYLAGNITAMMIERNPKQ